MDIHNEVDAYGFITIAEYSWLITYAYKSFQLF